jgi:hypothetical protein
MRDYGRVHTSFWSSPTIAALSEDGRMLALYLMTSPHTTIAGVFRLPDGYVSEDLRWGLERVAEGFRNLSQNGFADRCGTTKWVWIRKHLEWNPPENPNQRKAVTKVVASVPADCAWKRDFMRVCGPLLGLEPPPNHNPPPTVPEPFLNQEQEQEQEQEQKQEQEQEQEQECGGGENANPAMPPAQAPPADPPGPPGPPTATPRGRRLPADWVLPKSWGEWAIAEFPQWTPDKVRREASTFRDHWKAKTGKDATKLDWEATWRNWCRSDIAHRDDPKPPRASQVPPDTAARNAEARRLLGFGPAPTTPPQEAIDA